MIRTLNKPLALALLLLAAPVLAGCVSPEGATVDERRAYVRDLRDQALDESTNEWPELAAELNEAVGYAVYDTVNLKILVIGTANGIGMMVDNATGEESFHCHDAISVGPGFEVGSIQSLFVFTDRAKFEAMKNGEWHFGGAANAGLQFGSFGGAFTGVAIGDGVKEYRRFTGGVSLFAAVFWAKPGYDERLYEEAEFPGE
ncbi:MAG: lipid-binding SYLF domain-containing protein [Planctomycetota bacterium]|jgi:hypothetical protein